MKVPATFRGRLAVIVGFGALLRIALLVHRWDRPLKLNDSIWYSGVATGLRHGQFFRSLIRDAPTAEHPPLTSLLMAPLSFLHDPVQGQRLTTTLFGIALVAVIGVLGKRLGGPRVGLITAAVAAIYPNLWVHDGLVMAESIAAVFIVLWMIAMLRLFERPSVQRAAAVGAIAGVAALTRSELVLLMVASAAIVLILSRQRTAFVRVAAMLIATVLVLMPWTIVNLARFEKPVLLTTNDGTTLRGAYCDDVFYGADKGGWTIFCLGPETDKDDSIRAARQRSEAIAYARSHEKRLPTVIVARL
ncbi:MAG: glycosyltransferase family 39 protein, partial [Actinomycetota bacterium]